MSQYIKKYIDLGIDCMSDKTISIKILNNILTAKNKKYFKNYKNSKCKNQFNKIT